MNTSDTETAWRYLGIVPENGQARLRKSLVTIPDIVEVAAFVRDLGVRVCLFRGDSNINLTWLVDDPMHGPGVLSLGPKLSGLDVAHQCIAGEAGFLAIGKFNRVRVVCHAAREAGFPCPAVWGAGFDDTLQRAWILQEQAPGVNLEKVWQDMPHDQRLALVYRLGGLLVRLHDLKTEPLARQLNLPIPKSPSEWYTRRVGLALDYLQETGLYTPTQAERILTALHGLLNQVTLSRLSPLHGDILHHNLFVRQEASGWTIASVIDWETVVVAGDPAYDVILGAWWMAGEHDGDPQVFEAMVDGYNAAAPPVLQIGRARIEPILALAELTWYLNVLPLTHLRESSGLARRMRNIERVIAAVLENHPYLVWTAGAGSA
jgi:Ser/Thr protein kinase RdoA (MazF antagonist)